MIRKHFHWIPVQDMRTERLAMLKECAEHDRLIIEDDYDNEFRYFSKPIPCLQGLAGGENVVYVHDITERCHMRGRHVENVSVFPSLYKRKSVILKNNHALCEMCVVKAYVFAIRLSFMILPDALLPFYEKKKPLYNQTASKSEQLIPPYDNQHNQRP